MTLLANPEPVVPVPGDDAIATVGWLQRRAGFGLAPEEARAAASIAEPVGALIAGPGAAPADPWDGETLDTGAEGRGQAIQGWLRHLLTSTHPYVDRRTLMLHGWLVSSAAKSPAPTMADQIRLLQRDGGGSFPDLLRAITIDPAMLVFLDGFTSQAGAPNENYGRELLELFALGTGTGSSPAPYDEDDVVAAATALTGWVVSRRNPDPRFVPARHDPTPQTLLGVAGVSDVDGVIDAIVGHAEHPRFVADRIAREYVGAPEGGVDAAPDPDVVEELAMAYDASGRRLDEVIRAALGVVVDGVTATGRHHPIVSAPIPWMAGIVRTLGVELPRRVGELRVGIQAMGQIPLLPPSVAGWPGGTRWLTTSGVIARTNVAAALAEATPASHPASTAVDDGDLDRLAVLLGLLEPFSAATTDAIRGAGSPTAGLTLALVSPEYLLT